MDDERVLRDLRLAIDEVAETAWRMAMAYGMDVGIYNLNFAPEFTLLKFSGVEGLKVLGTGRFSQTDIEYVDDDVAKARAWAEIMETTYGGSFEVSFSTTNNRLDVEIEAVGYYAPEDEREIVERMQDLVIRDT